MDFRVLTEPHLAPGGAAGYDRLLRLALAAEATGYDGFFRTDHYPAGRDARPSDAWTTLAALARDTRTIRLGVMGSTVTFREPGVLAVTAADVDALAGGGRVEVALSMGWSEAEHTAYGIPLPGTPVRLAMYEEQLRVLRGVHATAPAESFSFAGNHYRIAGIPGLAGHPLPLIVGGGGIGADTKVALAARYADEFNVPYTAAKEVRAEYDKVIEKCNEINRDPEELRWSVSLPLCCGTTQQDMRRRRAATGRSPDELARIGVVGTPRQCADTLSTFAELGVDRVYLQILDLDDVDQIELFASTVFGLLN
uniref:Putative F420-dependent oxidoreductase n=1 Tax=Sphaerisporangium sp. SANK 60911 TaxID=1354075 RepID=V5YSA5_9ACTN|nr:putative F420-dependent oxidoreductase [Sphaerisporangium sp. SANK 60911]